MELTSSAANGQTQNGVIPTLETLEKDISAFESIYVASVPMPF